jgi:malonyl CoA-acyl carrier protein transacylase
VSRRRSGDDPVLWWLAGDDPAALLVALDELAPTIGDSPRVVTAGAGPARLGLVDPDERKVKLARRLVAKGDPWRGRSDIWFTPAGLAGPGAGDAKVAFLFPGVEPGFPTTDVDLPALGERMGLDVPILEDDTVAHQGASVFRLGIFLDAVMRRIGIRPDLVAGHSVGEWSGTVAAGIVPIERAGDLIAGLELDTIELPDVDFAALAAGVHMVEPVVRDVPGVVISHDNSPSQSIVCGPPAQVELALARLRDANVLGYTLPFQSGFHTPAIAPALETVRGQAESLPFGPAKIPMWSATEAGPYPPTRAEIIDLHLRHLVEPVRFRPMVERLHRDGGARIFVQVGLGSLTGFVDDTLGALDGADHASVQVLNAKRTALAQLHRALTALWVEGLDVRPDALRAEPAVVVVPEPAPGTAPSPGPVPAPASDRAPAPARSRGPDLAPTATTAPATPPEPRRGPARVPASNPATGPAPAPEPAATATTAPVDASEPGPRPVPAMATAGGPAELVAAAVPAIAADLAATTAAAATATAPSYALVAAADMLSAAAQASQDVIDALSARWSLPTSSPARAVPAAAPALALVAAPAEAPAPAAPATPEPEPEPRPWPTGKVTLTRRLSLESMPETIDHTLFQQPPDWPDVSDRFPIVAMTTQIQLLQDITADFAGGREVVEVFGIRNFRWLDLSDPLDLKVTVTPKGDDVLTISLGGYCRASVRVGGFDAPPAHDPPPLTAERPTQHSAQDLWDLRLMFHGPLFQGIDTIGPIGDDGMQGDFTHLETPGSLLDNLGKLIAYWVIDKGGIGEGALPVGVESIRFFGPPPEPGTPIHCDIRVLELQRDLVRADGVLVLPDGTVWCRVDGWASLVFHLDERMEPFYHAPSRNRVTEPQPGGWHVLRERWPTGPARDLTARRFMNRTERAAYTSKNLIEQRRYLQELICGKEAVRQWLSDEHGVDSFPVEVSLVPDGDRRFRVDCRAVPEGHDPRITLSSLEMVSDAIAVTVAIVGDGEYRDVEARQVPPGGDPDAVAAEAAELVSARNPGASVGSVPAPINSIPSTLTDVPDPPPFAVAWTA